ncbi:MAG TPA: NmrA family NAD(P)-binding protein, partial [Draconibacterium sp.]|nr:NmrA family NAD(P)-binding protein [Draconibacterium sp.]
AEVIIHCASNFLDPENIDVKGSRNLLSVIPKEKLKHLIYISIVGVDKSQYPYYKAKYEVEQMIMKSGLPYTNLRATQFHHFVLHRIIKPLDKGSKNVLQLPENFRFQSIDIPDVAKKIIELVGKTPQNETISIGGPEVLSLEKMAQDYLDYLGRKDKIELVPPEAFKIFQTGINLCPDESYGKITWARYLEDNLKQK